MDTNSKNKFTPTSWGTLLIILLLAAISVGVYAPIKDAFIKENTSRYLGSYQFKHEIGDLTSFLLTDDFEDRSYIEQRYQELKSIKYYIKKAQGVEIKSNIPDVNEAILQEEIKKSQFYLTIKTDETGKPTIESSHESRFTKDWFINESGVRQEFTEEVTEAPLAPSITGESQITENKVFSKTSPKESKNKYANLEIVYVISGSLANHSDLFAYNFKNFNVSQNIILILIIGAIGILLLTILAFAIPYNSQKQASLVRVFNRMYLEFKFFLWLVFLLGSVGIFSLISSTYYPNGYFFSNSLNFVNIIADANLFFYLIGIPITFILYMLIYVSIVYLKYINEHGFKEGLLKNSIFGKLLFSGITNVKKLSQEIIEVSTEKESSDKLLKILGINLVALGIIAITFPFGILLAIIYTIFLAKYLLKVISKIRSLNEATREIAEGNFTVNIAEDVGILNPIAKNLNNINQGFKVAVEKEIKSQNMKTELISNVSHDLKTPLTSIITYIDLLKNRDTDEQTQKEYLEVLEQKSKRLQILIEDLFEASKASTGNIDLHFENIDVIALLRQTLGEMEEKIKNSTLEIKLNFPDNKIYCELDGRRTYRIFENIMSNILKYSMIGSRVYIDILENEKEVSFVFKNISAYEMNFDNEEITERFTRGDKSRNTEGSGLGLAIAKNLTQLQKGKMDIIIDGDLFKLIITFLKI
ncbi:Signal transduction histidine kinase [Desulfonispora thiosulfatigenes DSM 11270]|uniref:histidine kinase n=1 Tax=Desulfonispora thiosulfatigenes DSM 11270 TaxID=656914 RepID=A0A1W1VDN3_DESTI|nr:HAMP domain-containing sensor histidine kinase [Desulfonispora thiosulfatigenes]SMB91323.1 Signal transduction histidine kinase [Desulfonispora thiosulfatigenes DSM 11270]